jgi:hypothetical protein
MTGAQHEKTTEALMAAVAKGVENGFSHFYDPGLSLITLRDLPIVRKEKLMYVLDWYEGCNWAKCEDAPQERAVRLPVESSFGKTFADQQKLLLPGEEVASVRVVATFLVMNALAKSLRLLSNCYVRCIDRDQGVNHVIIGDFGSDGFTLSGCRDGHRSDSLGLASSVPPGKP